MQDCFESETRVSELGQLYNVHHTLSTNCWLLPTHSVKYLVFLCPSQVRNAISENWSFHSKDIKQQIEAGFFFFFFSNKGEKKRAKVSQSQNTLK